VFSICAGDGQEREEDYAVHPCEQITVKFLGETSYEIESLGNMEKCAAFELSPEDVSEEPDTFKCEAVSIVEMARILCSFYDSTGACEKDHLFFVTDGPAKGVYCGYEKTKLMCVDMPNMLFERVSSKGDGPTDTLMVKGIDPKVCWQKFRRFPIWTTAEVAPAELEVGPKV